MAQQLTAGFGQLAASGRTFFHRMSFD